MHSEEKAVPIGRSIRNPSDLQGMGYGYRGKRWLAGCCDHRLSDPASEDATGRGTGSDAAPGLASTSVSRHAPPHIGAASVERHPQEGKQSGSLQPGKMESGGSGVGSDGSSLLPGNMDGGGVGRPSSGEQGRSEPGFTPFRASAAF